MRPLIPLEPPPRPSRFPIWVPWLELAVLLAALAVLGWALWWP